MHNIKRYYYEPSTGRVVVNGIIFNYLQQTATYNTINGNVKYTPAKYVNIESAYKSIFKENIRLHLRKTFTYNFALAEFSSHKLISFEKHFKK